MSRLASAASWVALTAGVGLLYLPVLAALQLGQTDETLALLTLVCVLGGTLVAWGIRGRFAADRRIAALAALVLTAIVTLGPSLVSPARLEAHHLRALDPRPVVLYWTIGSVLLVLPVVALVTLPGDWFERWWDEVSTHVMAIPKRRFAIGLVLVAFVLAAGFSVYCFGRYPTTADEIVQLWHARILLSGRLSLPPDANFEFFAIDNMIDRPHWYSQFPIGGPAVLAVGVAAGAPWLVNPVLTALTALNVYRLAQRVYGEETARAAAALFVASPMVLIMGGSQMNHVPTAWLLTIALAALPVWLESESRMVRARTAALIGLAVGAAAAIRPLDAVIATMVIGVVMLDVVRRKPDRASSLAIASGAGAIPVALLLIANWRTTGSPLTWGYQVLWGPNHSLGLHPDPLGVPHTAGRALLLAVRYAMDVNWSVTAWPVPVLILVAASLVLARTWHRWDALLLGFFGAQLLAYAFYWHNGQFAGPRFLFPAVPALLILAARAPFILAERAKGTWRRAALLVVPVCIAASWVRPMEPYGVRGIAREFRNTRRELKRDAPPDSLMNKLPQALVFVQEGAGARLVRRLWALGISHQDAARLIDAGEACSILEAVRAEEKRGAADTTGRLARIGQSVAPYDPRGVGLGPAPDLSFKVNAASIMTPACAREIAHDRRIASAISYGPMLLRNRFDALGRIGGQVIYVIDLSEHNETLRARFGDRQWFRWEIPASSRDTVPVLIPYDAGLFRPTP